MHPNDGPATESKEAAAAPVEVVETHSALMFFIDDRVYKAKKAVDLGFLDFTTTEARREACQREVELNRRLAPDVYLGVADLTGPGGEVCEHFVVMRRMPANRRLSRCVEQGEDVDSALRHIAHAVAALHAASAPHPRGPELASTAAVARNWTDGFDQLHHLDAGLDPEVCDRIEALVTRYLDGRSELFATRIDEGFVRDGHGDLQAEDIFVLADGPRILDCLEFDERYRVADVLADVAFLAMDLERLGRADLGRRFLDLCREMSAWSWPPSLAHHYIAYRAHVRAKVGAVRQVQTGDALDPAVVRLLDLAVDHLERARVRLVVVGGLPGTGKSTLATGLADRIDATVLRTDDVRGRLAPSPDDSVDPQRYSTERVDAVYEQMLSDARKLLRLGHNVVLDASWSDARHRTRAQELAVETASDLTELVCTAPTRVAAGRIARRRAEGADPSEATPAVAVAMAARFDPWPTARSLDTTTPPDEVAAGATSAVGWPNPS